MSALQEASKLFHTFSLSFNLDKQPFSVSLALVFYYLVFTLSFSGFAHLEDC